jgi:hypothetical protein
MRGFLPAGGNQPSETPATAVYETYVKHARDVGENRRSMEIRLGKALRKFVPDSPDIVGFRRRDGHYTTPDGNRVNGTIYVFPDLASCRASFVRLIGQEIDWPDEPTEWTQSLIGLPSQYRHRRGW